MKRIILLFAISFSAGCGVKGDPEPPLLPPELGRGQPTYRQATEEIIHPDMKKDPDDEQKK